MKTLIAIIAALAALPVNAQPFDLKSNYPLSFSQYAKHCTGSFRRMQTDPDFTKYPCDIVEITESPTALNLHFIRGKSRITYIVHPAIRDKGKAPLLGVVVGFVPGEPPAQGLASGSCEFKEGTHSTGDPYFLIGCQGLIDEGEGYAFINIAIF